MTDHTDANNYRLILLKKLERDPNDLDALIQSGILEFVYFHNSEKALRLLEHAVQIDSKNVKAKFWLAKCLYNDFFEYSKAELILKEALNLDPHQPECLSLLGWIIKENNGSINIAIEYVQNALKYAPDWPMLRYQLAGLFLSKGEIESAEKEIQKAFQISLFHPKITNEVERYYENVVTGRNWTDMKEEFFYLLESIQKAKKNRPNS